MGNHNLKDSNKLLEYLYSTQDEKWKKYHNGRTCFEAYEQIRLNLKPIVDDVERGAMCNEIKVELERYREIIQKVLDDNPDDKAERIREILDSDPVIFLNDHGRGHIDMVLKRASEITSFFFGDQLSEFETFVLVCAIEIHDIGNLFGRVNHEKNLSIIFDEESKNIIIDNPEKRAIKSIAMVHGGKNRLGLKDTISALPNIEYILGEKIRPRLLGAIVRFADELADDSSRASRGPLDFNIIGENSLLYQNYSKSLHTVVLDNQAQRMNGNNEIIIQLVYELDTDDLKKKYNCVGYEKFLLDEIYDRTLKMERERRYCIKFFGTVVNICRIMVKINIYDNTTLERVDTITYTLEDCAYPDEPQSGNIKAFVGENIRTGEEELRKIMEGKYYEFI